MSNVQARLVGQRVPAVRVGEMVDGQLRTVRMPELIGMGSAVIVGVPAAFSPVCSEKHLPSLVRNADRLRQAGVGQLVCVVTDNPWAIDAWAKVVDPAHKVRFLSDGNLSFTRALTVSTHEPKYFLGERSERYMLTVRSGLIESVRVEDHIANISCTEPDDFVLEEV